MAVMSGGRTSAFHLSRWGPSLGICASPPVGLAAVLPDTWVPRMSGNKGSHTIARASRRK